MKKLTLHIYVMNAICRVNAMQMNANVFKFLLCLAYHLASLQLVSLLNVRRSSQAGIVFAAFGPLF